MSDRAMPLALTLNAHTHHSIASLCGINIVRHLHAPPALRNSVIGNG